MYRRMAASSSRVLRCTPRRSCFSVSAANQRSTRLIHEELVGVKCRWKRGWRSSQRWIAGVLCVLELSRIRCTSSVAGTRSEERRVGKEGGGGGWGECGEEKS